MRNSELGRRLSVDPLADKYFGWSPYNYTANNPLKFIDLNGMSYEDLKGEGWRVLGNSRNNFNPHKNEEENEDDSEDGGDKKKNNGSEADQGATQKEAELFTYSSGTLTDNTELLLKLGQIVEIEVKNINILGTTIKIETSFPYYSGNSIILLPQQTHIFRFDNFGNEPMSWIFKISTVSDAFIVNYIVRSTWIPGMPPNPLNNPFNLKEQK